MLLCDCEIEALLRSATPIIENFDVARLGTKESPVKGATLNLTIGDIFVPGVAADELGGLNKPKQALTLESGQTAVLRSAEVLRMPKNIAGVGFPPSTRVSLAGLLSTNPGHIDPDYIGRVHLTVLNMGKTHFTFIEVKTLCA
jgi:deoxycytidine triphosphate deaminase